MRILSCSTLAICLSCLNSCVSAIIAGSGRSYSHLENPSVTVQQARKEFGEPVFKKDYRPPTRIQDTKVYRERAAEYPGYSPVVHAKGANRSSMEARNMRVSRCEVYNPKGWISEEDVTVYGMAAGILPVVGDLYMLPSALSTKQRHLKQGRFITFWYDENGRYIAHYDGDISAARVKTNNGE